MLFAGSEAYRMANVYKIKAHPETTEKDKRKWTRHMYGNHLADRAAACETGQVLELGLSDNNFISLQLCDVLKSISLSVPFYWGEKDGTPVLEPYNERANRMRLQAYLIRRDQYRAERGLPMKWKNRTVRHAARLWGLTKRSRPDASRIVRICWDWYQHGGNIRKQDRSNRGLCKLCDREDSQEHWIACCTNLGCVAIRKYTKERVQHYCDQL